MGRHVVRSLGGVPVIRGSFGDGAIEVRFEVLPEAFSFSVRLADVCWMKTCRMPTSISPISGISVSINRVTR